MEENEHFQKYKIKMSPDNFEEDHEETPCHESR